MSLAYLEASVLVSWALGTNDKHYQKANQIIENIKNKELPAITSTLAVMEVIDVIRKRITQWAGYKGHPKYVDLKPLKKEIEDKIQQFINGLTALAVQGYIVWDDPDQSVSELHKEAQDILYKCFGGFGNATKCKFCDSVLPNPKYFYYGVGQYDVQHAIIAREVMAKTVITFDRGFNDLSQFANFNTLRFDVR